MELALNLYGNWWNKFGYDYWNWFDAVVVAISLLSLTMGGVEGIGALRLLRAFRVVRLFKRAASLRKILKAINQAIPGMRDAFAILMLVMMLYAIMGVRPSSTRKGSPSPITQPTNEDFVGTAWVQVAHRSHSQVEQVSSHTHTLTAVFPGCFTHTLTSLTLTHGHRSVAFRKCPRWRRAEEPAAHVREVRLCPRTSARVGKRMVWWATGTARRRRRVLRLGLGSGGSTQVDFYGPDHDVFFGNFLKAFFTMFQMMTTEGWADIARDVMAEQGDSHAIFFVTFIMLGNIILANVVIAVLIEQVRCALLALHSPPTSVAFVSFAVHGDVTRASLHPRLYRRAAD